MAEEHDLLEKPQKYLINSEMAKFYLEMGLQIIKIYEFGHLAQEIVNLRRLADNDKFKNMIVLTNELTGNSFYFASLLNKEKHQNIICYS